MFNIFISQLRIFLINKDIPDNDRIAGANLYEKIDKVLREEKLTVANTYLKIIDHLLSFFKQTVASDVLVTQISAWTVYEIIQFFGQTRYKCFPAPTADFSKNPIGYLEAFVATLNQLKQIEATQILTEFQPFITQGLVTQLQKVGASITEEKKEYPFLLGGGSYFYNSDPKAEKIAIAENTDGKQLLEQLEFHSTLIPLIQRLISKTPTTVSESKPKPSIRALFYVLLELLKNNHGINLFLEENEIGFTRGAISSDHCYRAVDVWFNTKAYTYFADDDQQFVISSSGNDALFAAKLQLTLSACDDRGVYQVAMKFLCQACDQRLQNAMRKENEKMPIVIININPVEIQAQPKTHNYFLRNTPKRRRDSEQTTPQKNSRHYTDQTSPGLTGDRMSISPTCALFSNQKEKSIKPKTNEPIEQAAAPMRTLNLRARRRMDFTKEIVQDPPVQPDTTPKTTPH